jgi:glycosyltransferase involved in cell wall biosynthesis
VERVELSVKALRVLSMVEAASITGPLKPLLVLSSLTRGGFGSYPSVSRTLMTTRRIGLADRSTDELYSAVKDAGIEYLPIRERYLFDAGVLTKMHRAIVRFGPHIVETHDYKSHFLFFVLRCLHPSVRKVSWIAFHHGYTKTSRRVSLYQQVDRLTLRFADHVVTVCRPFASQLQRRGVSATQLSVISNTLDVRAPPSLEAVLAARHALGLSESDRIILSVGRLSKEKGHEDLLKAFSLVLDTISDAPLCLVVVGNGPERNRLVELARPYGRKILFAGHVADPWPLYHAAELFVLPSHSEGSPLVILEALAAGLPIVGTCVGGVPEVLSDGASAVLVPPRQPEDLSAAITRLLQDEMLRRRLIAAASSTLAGQTPAAYAQRLFDIYTRCLRTAKGQEVDAVHLQ